jgi:hypothetical protein
MSTTTVHDLLALVMDVRKRSGGATSAASDSEMPSTANFVAW